MLVVRVTRGEQTYEGVYDVAPGMVFVSSAQGTGDGRWDHNCETAEACARGVLLKVVLDWERRRPSSRSP